MTTTTASIVAYLAPEAEGVLCIACGEAYKQANPDDPEVWALTSADLDEQADESVGIWRQRDCDRCGQTFEEPDWLPGDCYDPEDTADYCGTDGGDDVMPLDCEPF